MSEALPFSIDRIRPSVVQIRIEEAGGDSHVVGTGFIVHTAGYALTAKHVAEGAARVIDLTGARLTVGLALPNLDGPIKMTGSFEVLSCEVVEADPRHDLALLRLDPNPFERGKPSGISRTSQGLVVNGMYGLAPIRAERPREGVGVAVSGYPLSTPTLISTSGVVASSWGVDMAEVKPPEAPDGFTIPDIKDSYLADVAVNPGNSGGPVFLTATGEVIGVCVAFRIAEAQDHLGMPLRYNSGLSVVVPIGYGIDLVSRHAVIT